jgi:hypothetical protein
MSDRARGINTGGWDHVAAPRDAVWDVLSHLNKEAVYGRGVGPEGYEFIPNAGAGGRRTEKQEKAQRQREEMSRAAREIARTAPPPTPELIERLRVLLARPARAEELVLWRLRLFCGHVVARHAHYTHTTVHAAFMGGIAYPECGLDPASIIAAEALGLHTQSPG